MPTKKKSISQKEKNEVALASLQTRLGELDAEVFEHGHILKAMSANLERLFKIVDSPESGDSFIEKQIAVLQQETKVLYRVLYIGLTALLGAIAVAIIKLLFS